MEDFKTDYEIIRSSRKTLALEIKKDGTLLVRAPQRATKKEIEKFVSQSRSWIEKNTAKVKERNEKAADIERLDMDEIHALADKALKVIPERVRYYAPIMGVKYGKITIRNQKTKWGSCSEKGNLNFNCLLMLMPDEIVDYVVVHELAHLKELNHSAAFWSIVESVLPDYKQREAWIKENGYLYMRRMWG